MLGTPLGLSDSPDDVGTMVRMALVTEHHQPAPLPRMPPDLSPWQDLERM